MSVADLQIILLMSMDNMDNNHVFARQFTKSIFAIFANNVLKDFNPKFLPERCILEFCLQTQLYIWL